MNFVCLSLLLLTTSFSCGHSLGADEEIYDAQAISQAVNSAHTTWTATPNNRFHGRPLSFIKQFLGTKLRSNDKMNTQAPAHHLEARILDEPIPESFDARDAWPQCLDVIRLETLLLTHVSNIRDQSACGSCWAVAAASCMSDRLCIASNASIQVSISASHLMSCCWTCGFGCAGGYALQAWNYFAKVGLVTGGEYDQATGCMPYPFAECKQPMTAGDAEYPPCPMQAYDTPACSRQCQDNYTKQFQDDVHFGKTAYSIPNDVASIQRDIMTYGAVEAGYTVYADFPSYSSGVYQHVTGDAIVGHAVRILGWGVEDDTPYWLIANSWNEEWGDMGGFFKMIRGTDECGIESGVVAGLV